MSDIKKGSNYIFTSGLGVMITLAMLFWIITVILVKGLGFFWPGDTLLVELNDGKKYLGEVWDETDSQIQLKIGNRDIYGIDFIWLNKDEIAGKKYDDAAVTFEREEYGNFYGFYKSIKADGKTVAVTDENFYDFIDDAYDQAIDNRENIEDLQEKIAEIMKPVADLQREISLLKISLEGRTEFGLKKLSKLQNEVDTINTEIEPKLMAENEKLEKLMLKDMNYLFEMQAANGETKEIQISHVVRYFQPNEMGFFSKSIFYIAKIWEFVSGQPRESNTEGGVFPAIFGTVLMVLLMSIAVVPFGVLAAIYLNEYAKQGSVVRFIRLSVNNLAGVPSIVFGVFGLGFFVYAVGGSIDSLFFSDKLPTPTFGTGGILWASLTLALLTLPVVVVATEEGILAVPRANKEGALALGSTKWQMIRKIVLPNAMPGILTGLILAISRGAGEVAPLMITGVVKLAPSLALDGSFPFLHLDRKFMHLGFHIYDVGFQSPNVEASKPMVYSTALLLIVIVVLLNIAAIYIRNSLRKKYKTATF